MPNNPLEARRVPRDCAGMRFIAHVDEENLMLDHDECIARPEKRRVPGANCLRASAPVRQVHVAFGAPTERLSSVDAHADELACDLLIRLDASVDARFVPEII